jgi:hypothetical protein
MLTDMMNGIIKTFTADATTIATDPITAEEHRYGMIAGVAGGYVLGVKRSQKQHDSGQRPKLF